jgi:cytochrome c-type biogenesis protein CcmF
MPIITAGIFAVIGYIANVRNPWTLITIALGGYAIHVTFDQMFVPMIQRLRKGESAVTAFVEGQLLRGRRRFGSYVVHAAMIVVLVAIAVSSSMRQTAEVHIKKGETQKVAGYDLTFTGIEDRQEPHRVSTIARFILARNGKQLAILEPRMNQYETMREPIGSPDVYTTVAGDFYVSIAALDPVANSVAVNVYITPMVGWIWIAVIVMGLGGVMALIPPRTHVGQTLLSVGTDKSVIPTPETP